MDPTFDLLTLVLLPDLDPRAYGAVLARGPLASVLARPDDHHDLLPPGDRAALRTGAARRRAAEEARRAAALGLRLVGRDEPHYPPWLRQIHDPPPVLWVRGTLVPGEGEAALAIVGARAATPVGLAFARALAAEVAAAGLTIVSGLARGIDTAAHQGALDARGRTVAVLGSGLDHLYPAENGPLADTIARGGAVVSEFPLGTPPLKAHFPRRNRVIAGWGRGVLVVEAGERSGSLSTADHAGDEGREVMAVPGHPTHPAAAGTNRLLCQGAALIRDASDVWAALELPRPARTREAEGEDAVLAALRRGVPASVDEIAARSGCALPDLLARLAELELGGGVRRLPGALFVRS